MVKQGVQQVEWFQDVLLQEKRMEFPPFNTIPPSSCFQGPKALYPIHCAIIVKIPPTELQNKWISPVLKEISIFLYPGRH